MKQLIYAVLCLQSDGGIGINNRTIYPFREIPGDKERFRELTLENVVIMGRKTFESLKKPLPDRINIVISRNHDFKNQVPERVVVFDEPGKALTYAAQTYPNKHIAIIGGAEIYEKLWNLCDYIYITKVFHKRPADTFVKLPQNIKEVKRERRESEEGVMYHFIDYKVIKTPDPNELKPYEIIL